jgi:serine phosphatase RsbU (regulator of sigma subunit)/anti-sigma regulatory factor (Ser/Thr protein kinase)/anti-anti-sigma regulatory factor
LGTHDDDTLGRLVGDAVVVRDAFEQVPMVVMASVGPDHRLVATNAAYRAPTGRSDMIGVPYRDAFPEVDGQQLIQVMDRVYSTGQPETAQERRAQIPDGIQEAYTDFRVLPRRDAGGAVNGLLIIATDVTDRVAQRQATEQRAANAEQRAADAEQRAADAERRYEAARETAEELTEALLPTALPVLPRARIAARYLVAGHEQPAGGDWFDAIPLAGGRIALAVGDVVGHGATAAAAIGQLRAVLAELLTAEPDLVRVLERTDAFAGRTPALRAATLALVVLDPADGTLRYTTCGHPPPLVASTDGAARFLDGTGTGPLGTGSAPILASALLAQGELVLLYSDGLIERPNRTIPEGMAELAAVAADAAADRVAAPTAAERVCQLTVELLARTGYVDDVTTLAAQRLAEPVPALRLELTSERASLTVARDAFTQWLSRLDATAEDREALHLAMVEIVTNAIEHAYPNDEPGIVELEAALRDDGNVEVRISDRGTWRRPDSADTDRGHGLMVAGNVVDTMLVSHRPQPGTVVALRHRLRRPAILAAGQPSADAAEAASAAEAAFSVDTSIEADGTARALVSGPVDIRTADQLTRRLLSACRGGTVPLVAVLTGVTQLASAGVRALYLVRERLVAHQHDLTLITARGSSADVVLDLVHLSHRAESNPALGLGYPGPPSASQFRVKLDDCVHGDDADAPAGRHHGRRARAGRGGSVRHPSARRPRRPGDQGRAAGHRRLRPRLRPNGARSGELLRLAEPGQGIHRARPQELRRAGRPGRPARPRRCLRAKSRAGRGGPARAGRRAAPRPPSAADQLLGLRLRPGRPLSPQEGV